MAEEMVGAVPKDPAAPEKIPGAESAYVPVRGLGRLVEAALYARASPEEAFQFGFRGSTSPESIQRIVVRARNAGVLKVWEPGGWGTVDDDDVLRGEISLEACARLMADEWRLVVLTRPKTAEVASEETPTSKGGNGESGPRTDSVGIGSIAPPAKRWSPEMLAALAAYRKTYGTKAAAERYEVSPARVRELLPSGKPKARPYSAFSRE